MGVLNEPIPGISQLNSAVGNPLGNAPLTFGFVLGTLAGLSGSELSGLLDFAKAVELINAMPSGNNGLSSGTLMIPLGSVNLTVGGPNGTTVQAVASTDLNLISSLGGSDPDGGSATNPLDIANNALDKFDGISNPFFAAPGQSSASCDFGTTTNDTYSLDFPILDNPLLAVQLLLGQNVPLFSLNLGASVGINVNIPIKLSEIGIPLNAIITVGVGLEAKATFTLTSAAFTSSEPLNGFEIQNASVTFSISIGATAGVDVGIGSLDLQLLLTLSDTVNITNGDQGDTTNFGTSTITFADIVNDPLGAFDAKFTDPSATITLNLNADDPFGDPVWTYTIGSFTVQIPIPL